MIKEEWETFTSSPMFKEISEERKEQLKCAFYAGTYVIMFRILPDILPNTDYDMKMLNALNNEIIDFMNRKRAKVQ
jgi:hypothetical protein